MSLKFLATPIGNGDQIALIGLSESNLVVGKTFKKASAGQLQSASERAFAWSDGTLTSIDVGPSFNSTAHSVGENNVIVGTGTNPSRFGVFGWVEENGIVSRLDGLGGTNVMPVATNGKIHCGQANLPNRVSRAVKWENGTCVDLGTLGGPGASATAINKKGSIVGSSRETTTNMNMSAYIVRDGKMVALPKLSPRLNWAYGINDNDDVVGSSDGSAVKWVNGGDKPVVLASGQAMDINNSGLVVGSTLGSPGFAFVHDGKSLINLNDVTEGLSGISLAVARNINNQGCITAYGFDSKYNMVGFLLVPM